MALNVFELFGKIVVDHSGAEKGIDKTVKHAKDAESNLSKTFKKIGGMVAAAFSVRAVVDFGKQCTQAYASIAAEESAFAQIMGDYADTAQAKLNAVADQTGVVSTRMTGVMTSLTAKFKGLGYDTADATTLAADGLLIASDAAAFWDMSLDESMSHLNSFINGSYEGGEAIGLFANDTQMAAYAIEQGIVKDAKAWAKLDEAQRQATRLAYAKQMMESSGATGQAAKEANAYANVMANLKEHWRQFQGIIGKPILEKIVLPAMQKLNTFMPKLNEAVQNGIVWLEEGFGKIKGYFEEVFTEDGINMDALPDALSNMFRDLGRSVGGLLSSFGQKLRSGWSNTVWPVIQKTFKAVFGIELPDWATVKTDISDGWNNIVWPAIQGFFTKTFGITLPSWEGLKTSISDGWNKIVWPAIKGFFAHPLEVILPAWETLKTNISDGWNKTVWPAIKGFFAHPLEVILPAWETLKTNISDGWNKTVWPAIKDFFTTAYEIVLPSWETLKTNIVNGWNNTVLPALSGLFEAVFEVKPEDSDGTEVGTKIREWWDLAVASIGDIFKAIFKVLPEDSDGTEVGAKIRKWWDSAVAAIGDVFKAIFSVQPEDEDGATTGEKIKTWWKSVVTYIGNIFRGFFGIDPEDETATGNKIIGWFEKVLIAVGDIFGATFKLVTSLFADDGVSWADKIKTWFDSVLESVGDIFGSVFRIELPKAKDVIDDIVEWWNGIVSEIALGISAVWNGIVGGNSGETGAGGDGSNGQSAPGGSDSGNPVQQRNRRYGIPSIDFDGLGGSVGNGGLVGVLTQLLTTQKDDIKAAAREGVAEGLSGVTITANVYAGDVNIDGKKTGSMVAPWVNLELGALSGLRG